jgi:HlyD family secretion protein
VWKEGIKFKLRVPKWLLGLLVLSLLAGGGYFAYSQIVAGQRQEARRRLQTVTVERSDLPITIPANGTVQPEQSVNVSPKNSGILKQLLVQEGDTVQQGQVLAYMDASDLQGQLTQAKGDVGSAQANLQKLLSGNRSQDIAQANAKVKEMEAALRQAEQVLQQNQTLYKAGAISRRDFTTAQADRDRAQAQLTQAKQALSLQQVGSRPEDIAQARSAVIKAAGQQQTVESQLNNTVIRAPFSGVVMRKFADPGSFVTPTTSGSSVSSATSSSILALASRNRVIAKVPESNISQIKVGQSVNILADAYPGKPFQGRVTQVAAQSTVEQNVTNFEIKIALDDPQNLLKAGMNVSVEFNVGLLKDALVIPTVAIVRQEQGTGVYVLGGRNNRPKFQPITTGVTVNDKTIITSGLEEGDKVLISFPQGTRPAGRTPSVIPGMGPQGGGRGGRGG